MNPGISGFFLKTGPGKPLGNASLNLNLNYSLSDGGGWSKMKVSFSVSGQSILKIFS